MTVDLTKLIMHSGYNAFKNSTIYTGTLTISGSTAAGTNIRTFIVGLNAVPDLTDISFNGPVSPYDTLRPANGWFKQGSIGVPTNNAGGGNPSGWTLYSSISGSNLIVTALYVQQFTTVEALTATDFSYRLIDYSVF